MRSFRKSWLFTTVVLCFTVVSLSEARHGKKLTSAVVVGTVYCDTCFQEDFAKTSHFISGALVAVECGGGKSTKPSFREEVKTNNQGEFKVHLPFSVSKHVKRIEACSVKLISSSEPYCAVASTATSSSLHLKSRKQGTHIFSAGFFTFKPLKQPALCNQKPSIHNAKELNAMKFLNPFPENPTMPNLPPLPGLPSLPPLPQLPPLPPLQGFPNFPPMAKLSGELVSEQQLPQIPPAFGFPFPPNPFQPPSILPPNPFQPPSILPPNPFQPPSILPPNPFQPPPASILPPNPLQPPPASIFPPNPFQPTPPPASIFPPNPFQPTPPPASIFPPNPFQPSLPSPSPPPPLFNLPPIPGLTPRSPPPTPPTSPISFPPFPFQPAPRFPGIPPASSSPQKTTSTP